MWLLNRTVWNVPVSAMLPQIVEVCPTSHCSQETVYDLLEWAIPKKTPVTGGSPQSSLQAPSSQIPATPSPPLPALQYPAPGCHKAGSTATRHRKRIGNGSAVNEHIRKEQELSKPNLTSIKTNLFVEIHFVPTNKPQLKE